VSRERDGFSRALGLGLVLVALLVGGGWFIFERFVEASPAPVSLQPVVVEPAPPMKLAPPHAPERARVVALEGTVKRARGADWVAVNVGDELSPDDAIRTAPGAWADLQVGGKESRLTLRERSEVRVGEVTDRLHAFELAQGRLQVDYRGREARVLRVQSHGGAVAETQAARFTMLRSGAMVAVATEVGSVKLSGSGSSVQVEAGQQAMAFNGAQLVGPEPIPLNVLLRVANAAPKNETLCLSVKGQVRPGTEVLVEGEPAEVSPEGHFRVDIPRSAGRDKVTLVAREPGGTVKEQLLACRSRTVPEKATLRFQWGEGR
jgi:hypothetical protein